MCIFLVIHVGELLPGIFEEGRLRFPSPRKYSDIGLHALVKKRWLNRELCASLRHFLQDFHPLGDGNETESWVPVLGIFVLWFHYARGSRGCPFSSLISDILPLYS